MLLNSTLGAENAGFRGRVQHQTNGETMTAIVSVQ